MQTGNAKVDARAYVLPRCFPTQLTVQPRSQGLSSFFPQPPGAREERGRENERPWERGCLQSLLRNKANVTNHNTKPYHNPKTKSKPTSAAEHSSPNDTANDMQLIRNLFKPRLKS